MAITGIHALLLGPEAERSMHVPRHPSPGQAR